MTQRNREFGIYITVDDELITTERVALVAFALADGEKLTTRQVAAQLSVTRQAAWLMLTKMSRVLPIVEDGGIWSRCRSSNV